MNQHLHRIVFNKARGLYMAVAETASGHGRATGAGQGNGAAASAAVRPLTFSLWLALGMVSLGGAAQAQIVADRNAPRTQQPTVLPTPTGAVQVNIQTPSAAGVSRNTYSQFDVGAQGAVLNNSRTGAPSALAGAVGANPWMARGTARVILNEVNSNNPSQLRGYIEVAGDRAQVVIANPAGITCDGCGFINASRATVTTGSPVINGGNLEGYRVERGHVAIEGRGMDARGADYADIIARSVQVNAGVWANKLKVTQGANLVSADNSEVSAGRGQGAAPAVGLDVSQLGGMYAGHITLVGTEAGMGVRNAGVISAQAGDVFVTADGKLINIGQINSSGRLQADAAGGIDNSGSVYAKGEAVLQTRGHLRNAGGGFIGSAGDLRLRATGAQSRIESEKGSTLAAGLTTEEDGQTSRFGSTGSLFIDAADGALIHGQSMAGGDINVSAKAIDASYSQFSGQNLMFVAMQGGFDAQGATVLARGSLQARIGQAWRSDEASVSAASLDIAAHELSNRDGQIVQTGSGPLNLVLPGGIDNTDGVIVAQAGAVNLGAATLANQGGHISAENGLSVEVAGSVDNRSGTLSARGELRLRADALDNQEGFIGGKAVSVETQGRALDNRGGLIQADGDLVVDTHGQALLNSNGDTSAKDKTGLLSTGAMVLRSGAVDNVAGRIWAGGGATLNGAAIDNTGGGSISGVGNAVIIGADLDNRGGQMQFSGDFDIDVGAGTVDNTGSLIRAGGTLVVTAGVVHNNDTRPKDDLGLQGQDVRLNAELILNQRGAIIADNDITLGSAHLIDNTGGLLSAIGTLTLRDTGSTDLAHNTLGITNTGGTLVAGRHIGIDASRLGLDGKVISGGSLDLRVNTNLGDLGELSAVGRASITTTGNFVLDTKIQGGEGLAIHAHQIDLGANASIITQGDTQLQSDTSLSNRGLIDGAHTTVSAETRIDNVGGRIYGDHVSVEAETVDNTSVSQPRSSRRWWMGGSVSFYHSPGTDSYYETAQVSGAPAKGAGVIGARERLDVAATNVNVGEGSELVSEGSMHFGGTLDAQGRAQGLGDTLRVSGGAVRAEGDITYGVKRVIVERSRPVVISTRAAEGFTPTTNSEMLFDTGGEGRYRARETKTTTQTENYFDEAASGRAGVLESGGSMHFGDARLHNDQSRVVAVGEIDLPLDHYSTGSYTGERATKVSTRIDEDYRDKKSWYQGGGYHNDRTVSTTTETITTSVRLDLSTAELRGSNINLHGKDDTVRGVAVADAATLAPVTAPTTVRTGGVDTQAPGVSTGAPDPSILHRAAPIDLTLPTSSLYTQHDAGAPVLVTTDAQFAGYRNWLDSSYLLKELGVDPNSVGPRLGDGYYEQRLVREQTSRLIGTRLLDAQQNNETEYILLMKEGVAFAQAHQLQVGQPLTPDQLAKLTTDIVWLVRREVTRADGSTMQALVPQVYARTTDAEQGATGSLIAGNRVQLSSGGGYANTSTVVGRDSLRIEADNIHNSGLLRGGSVALQARTDITDLGGQIRADRALTLDAGRDIIVASTTRSSGYDLDVGGIRLHEQHTDIDRLASLSVRGAQGQLSLKAGGDISLTAAALTQAGPGGQTSIDAGRDLRLGTVGLSHASGFHASEDIEHLRTVSQDTGTVIVGDGKVSLRAGGDVTARAASVSSEGDLLAVQAVRGSIELQAGTASDFMRDARVSVDTGTFKVRTTTTHDETHATQAVASVFSGKELLLKAGQDIGVQGSELNAEGRMEIDAGRDLTLDTYTASGELSHERNSFQQSNSLGRMLGQSHNVAGVFDAGYAFLKKKAEDQLRTETWTQAQGSSITAGALSTRSGRDTTLSAATVVVENDLRMHAGRDLSLLAAEQSQADFSQTSNYANGQLGSWWQPAMGSAREGEHQEGSSTTHVGTQVASLKGSVSLSADGRYTQTASTLAAPEGNIDIRARQVQIDSAFDRGEATQGNTTSRTAVGGSVSIPILDALRAARSAIKSGEETRNSRMKGMAAINAGLAAKEAVSAAQAMNGKGGLTTGIKISANVSHNESHSNFEQSGTNAIGSTVAAGGDLSIQATGGGADSQLNVLGSELSAGNDTRLKADGAIRLAAAENTAEQKSTDGSSGASVGISFALLGEQNGFTIDLAASRTRGRADGTDSTWNNTHVVAGKTLTLESGGDTTLQGAVVQAERVTGKVGGDLHIESLQNKSTYDSKQESAGINLSLCIPPICYGSFVSAAGFNFGSTRINANQRYVAEQSGIFAGDGGYDVQVQGHTTLVGGVIAASQKALDQGKTHFDGKGGVTQRDLVNVADFDAQAFAVSAQVSSATSRNAPAGGGSAAAPAPAPAPAPAAPGSGNNKASGNKPSASAGFGSDGEHLESLTRSGIGVSTSTDTAGILHSAFNVQQVRQNIDAQVKITQTFSQKAPQAVADLSDYISQGAAKQTNEARQYLSLWRERQDGSLTDPKDVRTLEQLERNQGMTPESALATLQDPGLRTQQELFVEGGAGRVVLHTLTGALGGGLQGALGAASVAVAAPQLDELQARVETSARNLTREIGLDDGYSRMFGQVSAQLTATGVGAVAGASVGDGGLSGAGLGGGFALAVDTNNRQLHWLERSLIEKLAREKAEQGCRGNDRCLNIETMKWTDALERVAKGLVDDEEFLKNEQYLRLLTQTQETPGSEGARGGVRSYFAMLRAAEAALKPYMGANIQYKGVTATDHGAPQTYFGATAAQRADRYGNYFLGEKPGNIVPGMSGRDQERLVNMRAINGSAEPIYPVEEFVLGGAYGDRLLAAVGRGLSRLVGEAQGLGVTVAELREAGSAFSLGRSPASTGSASATSTAKSAGKAAEAEVSPVLDFTQRRGVSYGSVSTTDANGSLVASGSVVPQQGGGMQRAVFPTADWLRSAWSGAQSFAGDVLQFGRTHTASVEATTAIGNTASVSEVRLGLRALDSSTPSGSLVSHGIHSTAIGSDSATMTNFNIANNTGNGHNVIVHGSRPDYDELGGLFWVDGNATNSQQIVDAVLSNPNYRRGSPICMGSCWAASNGTAQQVADGLGATVTAFTRPVAFDSTTGQWKQMSDAWMRYRHPDLVHIPAETKTFTPASGGF